MSVLALAETLLNHPMQRRFAQRSAPRQRASISLLQDAYCPSAATPIFPHSAEEEHLEKKAEQAGAPIREFTSPDSPLPEVQLLSNGRYHVMLTQAGGGYSRWNDLAVTRWREDGTLDPWGQYIFLRDADSGKAWCAAYQPVGDADGFEDYHVQFQHSHAEFRRAQHGITSHLSVCVSPEDDAEIRQLKLVNTTRHHRRVEVLTYAEVVLNPPGADAAHPAFGNLFVQTELLPEKNAILCTRRPRESNGARPVWMFHLVTIKGDESRIRFRSRPTAPKFIGRGHTIKNPIALQSGEALSGSAGSVLDPIVAVKEVIELEPGFEARGNRNRHQRRRAAVESRRSCCSTNSAIIVLCELRTSEMAWTNAT